MSKRFTDTNKWKNTWFRELSSEAKLAWIYLCDECDYCGIIKLDYPLANFQLNFNISKDILIHWFAEKLFFFDEKKLLIVPFFEFQYAESKDTWSAKIKAKEKLENLGFVINNNKLDINLSHHSYHSTPTVPPQSDTVLIKGIVKGNINKEEEKEIIKQDSSVEKFNSRFNSKSNEFNEVLERYGLQKRMRIYIGQIINTFETAEEFEYKINSLCNSSIGLNIQKNTIEKNMQFELTNFVVNCLKKEIGAK